jgi:sugar phosphate isomerase/epimerase
LALAGRTGIAAAQEDGAKRFGISLAAWSLHRAVFGKQMDMLDMPRAAREDFGIEALELVSTMLASREASYFEQLKANAAEHNVKLLLNMVDGEGDIGAESAQARREAVKNHQFWVDVAADMECHSIRMNWRGAPDTVMLDSAALKAFIDRSAEALNELCDYADKKDVNVIIENHGGPSSYPTALVQLMTTVDHPRFGTLPDFGNFPPEVDTYQATDLLMSFAKAVSAKCYGFDPQTGDAIGLDYDRLMDIVLNKHGYSGYVGIEYSGQEMSEYDGVKACKRLLERYQ